MFTIEEHLDNLIRHIDLVRSACILLGKKLIKKGERKFGVSLIARGFEHDQTKFYGLEWEYLHAGNDISKEQLTYAIKQHVATNDHHPEYHNGVNNMPDIAIAEMVCDWYARSQEFGTSLRDWYTNTAVEKYQINEETNQKIKDYIDLILEDSFVKQLV